MPPLLEKKKKTYLTKVSDSQVYWDRYGPRMCNVYRLGHADRNEPLCKQTRVLAHKNINYNYIISNEFYSEKVIKMN
jgi:hypothetical protein